MQLTGKILEINKTYYGKKLITIVVLRTHKTILPIKFENPVLTSKFWKGDDLTVEVEPMGNDWNGKWYVNLVVKAVIHHETPRKENWEEEDFQPACLSAQAYQSKNEHASHDNIEAPWND